MKVYEGKLSAKGLRLGIVISRFNDLITKELLSGAEDCWLRHDGLPSDLEITWVPGAFEIPVTAELLCKSKNYDALVCLGAVIRGGTPHFDYVANEVSKGVAQVAMNNQMPVIFGVITTDNIEQALERAGTKSGNKGWNATLSAIEMANLFKNIK
jgi:6,7-dimethyl-8-ribityllumazine synthase